MNKKVLTKEELKIRNRRYYLNHRQKIIDKSKNRWANEPDKVREYQIKRADNIRNSQLKYVYGITLEDYNKLFKLQNGLCAICDKPQSGKYKKRLCVDHEHETDMVRGLLCHKCNVGIGLFDDDIKKLESAVKYLKKNG